MTVYVDDFRVPARVGRINARWSHLTADTQAELHGWPRPSACAGPGSKTSPTAPGTTTSPTPSAPGPSPPAPTPVSWREFHQVWTRPGREGRQYLDQHLDQHLDRSTAAGPPATGWEAGR